MMSDQIKEFKGYIKHARERIKTLNEEQQIKGINAARQSLIDIYTRDLAEHEVALRGLQLRARVEKSGMDYDAWEEWAKSLYDISVCMNTDQFVVTSKARDWSDDTDMSWAFPDDISCKEKIEQLIGYKIADRKRGRGDIDKDLQAKE